MVDLANTAYRGFALGVVGKEEHTLAGDVAKLEAGTLEFDPSTAFQYNGRSFGTGNTYSNAFSFNVSGDG